MNIQVNNVTGVDAQALVAARQNAELNNVQDRLAVVACPAADPSLDPLAGPCGDLLGRPPVFDACVANILQVGTPVN